MKFLLSLLLSVLIKNAIADDGAEQALANDINAILKKNQFSTIAGIAYVAIDDQVVVNQGLGFADVEKKIPFKATTMTTVGSITKQFTGAAISKLEMQGKLTTEDKISQHLPGLKGAISEVTLHELLTHTAGITEETGRDDAPMTKQGLIEHLNKQQLAFPRGEHHYSNLGYSLLGMVVEGVSGKPLDVYLAENFFDAIGMKNTGYTHPNYKDTDTARGYFDGEDWGYLQHKNWQASGPYWNLRANGGMLSTAQDMHLWMRALMEGDYLGDVQQKMLFGMHVKECEDCLGYYGYGWVIEPLDGDKIMIWHNGGNGIFSADVRYYPESKLFYFVAGNRSDGEIYDLSDALHELLSEI